MLQIDRAKLLFLKPLQYLTKNNEDRSTFIWYKFYNKKAHSISINLKEGVNLNQQELVLQKSGTWIVA